MLDGLQYWMLKKLAPGNGAAIEESAPYKGRNKTKILLGEEVLGWLKGKTVIDFGCGQGNESVELAQAGVAHVIGLDNRESILQKARQNAAAAGVQEKCEFVTDYAGVVDAVISLDAFEHFSDPAGVLKKMDQLLKPGGAVYISFGPSWYHPRGGHLFSMVPWAHVIFSEKALIRWRNDIRKDGATKFSEVEGGLNQMTIARFEELVHATNFKVEYLNAAPIRKLRFFHNRLTREFFTAVVRCKLIKPA
jgi:2-polyprenyl-3-methyl-5-hydroxy-6-metoxy-1,4-benzoquinol methylase